MISFDLLPKEVAKHGEQLDENKQMLATILGQKREAEQPINSKELMKRLDISEPTLIAMRKRGDIPYINVRGHFRYDWQAVIAALQNRKKGVQ